MFFSLKNSILLQLSRVPPPFFAPPPPIKRLRETTSSQLIAADLGRWWGQILAGLGIRSFDFQANCLFFCQKMSEWAIHSKKWAIHSFAHFWWAKWAIRSHRSFPLRDLSESLMVAHIWWAKWAIRSHRSQLLFNMSDFEWKSEERKIKVPTLKNYTAGCYNQSIKMPYFYVP